MPSRFKSRQYYSQNQFLHITNRGANRQAIFHDHQDYHRFLYLLHAYTGKPQELANRYPGIKLNYLKHNLHHEISVHAYCLMPNHFHLLLEQKEPTSSSKLMQRLTLAYVGYYKKKYSSSDSKVTLFQGTYGASLIKEESSLMQQSRYIHLNPFKAMLVEQAVDYPWSSIQDYRKKSAQICKTDLILSHFKSPQDYLSFIQAVQPADLRK